jgi:hypothetical protein
MDEDIRDEWEAIQQINGSYDNNDAWLQSVFGQAQLVERVTSIQGVNTGKAIRFPNQVIFVIAIDVIHK